MIGKLLLIKPGIGKIKYLGKESEILFLPKTFKHGDIVYFNIDKGKLDILYALSSIKYYGTVINPFGKDSYKQKTLILITYPEPMPPIHYETSHILPINTKVKFKLKKTLDNKIIAVDVEKIDNNNEFHKCNLPTFTTLKEETLYPKVGAITDIITIEKQKNSIPTFAKKGTIIVLKEKGFGFIKVPGFKINIFFHFSMYKKAYNKNPQIGDIVHFSQKNTNKGLAVSKFYSDTSIINLPKNRQYILIDKKHKIGILEYEKIYGTPPTQGDIVYYINLNGKIKLLNNDAPIKVIPFTHLVKEKPNWQEGIIINKSSQYDSITIQKKHTNYKYNYSISKYKSLFKKAPQINETIYFTTFKDENTGKTKIKHIASSKNRFVIKRKEQIFLKSRNFKNFVSINKNQLYFVYSDGKNNHEVFKYNKNSLSQSISVYKQKDKIPSQFVIEAIECILKNNYTSKNITQDILEEDYANYLYELSKQKKYAAKLYFQFGKIGKYKSSSPKIRIIKNFNYSTPPKNLKSIKFTTPKFNYKTPKLTKQKIHIIESKKEKKKIFKLSKIFISNFNFRKISF